MSERIDGPTLADLLVQARAERGLSQAQAAEELGVLRQLYARWERGARPQPRNAVVLGAFLGLTPTAVQKAARRDDAANRIALLERRVAALQGRIRELEGSAQELEPAGLVPEDSTDSEWLSIHAAARVLGVTDRTVYRLIDHKGLPGHRYGRRTRIRRTDLNDWVEAQRLAPGDLEHLLEPRRPGGLD